MHFNDKTERLLAIESGIMKVRADIVTILTEVTQGTVDKDTAATV
jgi:F0F1-type ATP synthase epsilon subunit